MRARKTKMMRTITMTRRRTRLINSSTQGVNAARRWGIQLTIVPEIPILRLKRRSMESSIGLIR
jgi:hypothetical protein